MKLLLIEDDLRISKNLCQVLVKDGFAVDTARTKEAGLIEADVNDYDCIILDLNLPDGSGFDLLTKIRQEKDQTPVIIVTAREEIDDRIKGLNSGGDDYVTKPVDSNELIARIRAVIRRNSQASLPEISIQSLVVKPAEHIATLHDHQLDLTAKEFAVLEYLALHFGQVVTRTMLMEHVWGSDFDTFSNVIDVYIRNLRRKLEAYSDENLIRTIRGKGYVLGKLT